jgi:hypothetical protein
MHIKLLHGKTRQMHDGFGIDGTPRRHSYLPALADQLFTHMGTDKAGTTENNDFFHGVMMRLKRWELLLRT